jgi:environmental stress-induced protein Ves
MNVLHLPAHRYERQPWRNGAGSTREIWREGKGPDWRVSIADIEADGAFSRFPGLLRRLVLLSGDGLRLDITPATEAVELHAPYGAHSFPGDAEVSAARLGGRCQAFNLMWNPQIVDAELLLRPLVGSMLFFPRPGESWLLHLASGQARLRAGASGLDLAQGDSALLRGGPPAAGGRLQLEGGGETLLVRVRPRYGESEQLHPGAVQTS